MTFVKNLSIGVLSLVLVFESLIRLIIHYTVQKILDYLLANNVVYNVAVEDPRQDKEMLQIQADDVIAMITTGGCNVLDRAIDRPKHIYAVDCNPSQNSILELKLACIKHLTYEEMWAVWGEKQDVALFHKLYTDKLREKLPAYAQRFWDNNWRLIGHWHSAGSTGKTLWLTRKVFGLLGQESFFRKITDPGCTFEQQKREWASARKSFKRLCDITWSFAHLLAPFIGVPSRQMSIIEGNLMFNMFDHVFSNTHLSTENYICYAYIKGHYIKQCCPRYLTPNGFATLKQNLKDDPNLVSVHTAFLSDVVTKEVKEGDLTVVILLDSQDWMPDKIVRDQLQLLKKKMHPKKGRIFFRSASDTLTHPDLVATVTYDTELVDSVKKAIPCQLGSYPGTFLGRFNGKESSQISYMPFPNNSFADDMKVFRQMYFGKLVGSKEQQETLLESFYKTQADKYDGYRQYMLHGRGAMIAAVPLDASEPIVWADFGCGTGSNFELVEKKYVKKIYGIDLCQSLLDVAKVRVQQKQIPAELIKADASKKISKIADESVDVVTFSYSLTMIPDWKASVREALRVLKPGGWLCVSDFTTNPNHMAYSNYYWQACFSHDYVFPSEEHRKFLKSVLDCKLCYIGEGGFPYIPLLKCPYYTFAGQKKL